MYYYHDSSDSKRAVKSLCSRAVLLAGLSILVAGTAQAQLLNVDFNQNNGAGWGGGGVDPGPTMSGPAVIGTAGDQSNGINVNNGAGIPLFYASGAASGVTMSFTAGGGYGANEPNWGGNSPFNSTPYQNLMEDYLYTGPTTITLAGLLPNQAYSLFLYNAADNNSGVRTTVFTVNGNNLNSIWDATSSTLISGVTYVNFPSALSDGSGVLVINVAGAGGEGDINGFQLLAVPEPSSLALFSTGLLALLGYRRSFRRS